MNGFKMKLAVVITALCFGKQALAIDISTATLELSGSVPAVFSVTARGLPGDLDLTPGVQVQNRLIGILHFKYNMDVDTINVVSSTASGKPETAAASAYPFNAGNFVVAPTGACTSLNAAAFGGSIAPPLGIDGQSVAAGGVEAAGAGIEEDCQLAATWDGQLLGAGQLPIAGVYSMSIQITMTSL